MKTRSRRARPRIASSCPLSIGSFGSGVQTTRRSSLKKRFRIIAATSRSPGTFPNEIHMRKRRGKKTATRSGSSPLQKTDAPEKIIEPCTNQKSPQQEDFFESNHEKVLVLHYGAPHRGTPRTNMAALFSRLVEFFGARNRLCDDIGETNIVKREFGKTT